MKRRKIYLAISFFIVIITVLIVNHFCITTPNKAELKDVSDTSQLQPAAPNDEEILREYYKTCKSLNLYKATEYSPKDLILKKEWDEAEGFWITRFRVQEPPKLRMTFDLRNARILLIFSFDLTQKLRENKHYEPLLNEKEAHSKAMEYMRGLCIKYEDYSLKLIRAEFYKEGESPGRWFFAWIRCYGGYNFAYDMIRIEFSETYGLICFINSCTSHIPPILNVKISEENAKQIALEYAKELMASNKGDEHVGVSNFKKYFAKYKIGDIESAELMIIHPNFLLVKGGSLKAETKPRDTRLAWQVTIKAMDKRGQSPEGYQLSPLEIWLWIDAATGEWLGGNFTM